MTTLAPLIQDLSVLLITAAVVTLLFRKLKLPLVLGYLTAGIFVGPFFPLFPSLTDVHNLEVWAEIGVIFLLFTIGLEFSYKRLVHVGRSAFVTGLFEVGFVFFAAWGLARLLSWPPGESLFFAGAMAISSTSIIARSFGELNLKGRRFVSLVFGVLLVEDLLAVLLLVMLPTLTLSRADVGWELFATAGKFGFFVILCFVLGMYLVPLLLQKVRSLLNEEMILILSVALCLAMVVAATRAGLSSALGAFLMGSILAGTPEGEKIEERLSSLRDLFSAIFFVSIGMLIDLDSLWTHFGLVLGVSLFLIAAKFLAVNLGSLLAGQSPRHSLQTALSLTQIGEFSFLIAKLGQQVDAVSPRFFPLIVLVSALTSFATPLLLRFSDPIVGWLQDRIPIRIQAKIENFQTRFSPRGPSPYFRVLWRAYGMKVTLNTILILGLTWIVKNYAWSFLLEIWPFEVRSLRILTVVVCVLLCLPFFWALLIAQPPRTSRFGVEAWERLKRLQNGLFMARLILTTLLLVFVVSQFLSYQSGLWMLGALFIALFLLRSRAEKVYRRIESRFLDHLNEKEREELSRSIDVPPLAPWDAQLVEMVVSADSPLIGKNYLEAGLRDRFGVTVALLQRGHRQILAPNRLEKIYPGDRLFVIGVEEQILAARPQLETRLEDSPHEDLKSDFGLEFLVVESHSPLVGQSLRECGLREKVEGLVVGIERGGRRILNPDSGILLEPYDLLWIVGSRKKIDRERAEQALITS